MAKDKSKIKNLEHILTEEKGIYGSFAIDLSKVEYIRIDEEIFCGDVSENHAKIIEEFVKKYPDFVWATPYEGYVTWLFSKKIEVEVKDTIMYHRGGGAIVGNILVSLDLD